MIEHYELYFIQRTALRNAGGSASLRAVTLDPRGTSAYLAFRTRDLAQAFIDAEQVSGMTPVSATAPGLNSSLDFDGALALLLENAAEVAQFGTAPTTFDLAGHLHRCRTGAGKPGWHPAPDALAPAGKPARETGHWGLLPERGPGETLSPRKLLLHFFVEFNPLYFISAFCVLYGVFLVARNIEELRLPIEAEQFVLFGVIQLYEALVIAGAAFLAHRAHATRPAVLLGLLECVLLFDCTFRVESAAVQGSFGHLLMVLWLLLTAAKVWGLARALRLPLARPQFAALMATAAGMAACIAWLSTAGTNKPLALQVAAWFGAFVIFMLEARRPALPSALARDDKEQRTAALCVRAGFRILIGFYFYHLAAYVALSSDTTTAVPALAGTVFLLYALLREKQAQAWCFGLLTIAAAALSEIAFPCALVLVGLLWLYRVRRGAHSNLAIGSAFALYGAAWLAGWDWQAGMPPLPDLLAWQTIALAAGLACIAMLLHNPAAWALLAATLGYSVYTRTAWNQIVPHTGLGRGVLFLASGFAALIAGVAINWVFRSADRQELPTPSSA